jgi:nucleoside-diphosphate-sugar epimerase
VLTHYGLQIAARAPWIGYLSSTGVYGDTGGAWVDETAPIGTGRRSARSGADMAWQALHDAHIFRLPGIYGPGRSAIDRVRSGEARRVEAPGHIFSRIHVDDIVETVIAAMRGPRPGVYNVTDDKAASGATVIEVACDLIGAPYPPTIHPEQLGPQARGFYSERRRVSNGKMKRDLGVRLRYPDYMSGLRACLEEVR